LYIKVFLKKSLILSLSFSLLVMPLAQMKKVEAASIVEKLLYATVAVGLITAYYNNANDNGQDDILKNTQKQTGVYDDEEAEERIDAIHEQLMESGSIKSTYAIYANPKEDFNAFCTLGHVISINKGTLDRLDDDELALVMSHEIAHGEGKHVVNGITKGIGLALAVDLFLESNRNDTSSILSAIGANFINNEMFTMEQEWEADNRGFDYAIMAGFNPGGAAASMVKLRSEYGELYHEGLGKIINPNNHPKTSDRINNFLAKLTAYSKNRVTVKNNKTVLIDNKEIITPTETSYYLGEERAYLIAGNLATVYHNQEISAATAGDDGAIYIGDQVIVHLTKSDISANELVSRLNAINTPQ